MALFAGLGALGGLGHPPVAIPLLALVSLILLVGLRPWRLPVRSAAWALWAYGAGYFGVAMHWIVEPFLVDIARHGWMAPFAILLLAGGLALFYAAAGALAAWRGSGVVFALAFAGAEIIRAHIFTGFPWAMHVTAFVDVALYQAAAFAGPHGLTLLLMLALMGADTLRGTPVKAAAGLALLIPLALASTFGLPAPEAPSADAPLLRVVQPNARQDLKWREDMMPVFLDRKITATAALPHAELVIWPESSLPTWLETGQDIFTEAARRGQGAELLIGAQSWRREAAYNGLAHISPEGEIRADYLKHHLVPFGEYMPLGALFSRLGIYGLAAHDGFGYAAGAGPAPLEIPGIGTVQPLICYESVFPHEVGQRALGGVRPRLLVVVTNDAWFGELGGPAQHLQQAQARAIEQGLPLARSANTGISAIIDARGRILAALPLGT
ncbi:MAG: apolipoprotein N-acyltransferase, partial [Pseudomonadota bacterium]